MKKPAFNKTKRKGEVPASPFFIAAAILLLGACAAARLWPERLALTLADQSGRIVYAEPAAAGDPFTIEFIHSVHRTPVEERYRIGTDHDLVLESMVYESYGIGNPSAPEPGQTFRKEDGKLIIENIDRHMQAIDQRIGQLVADHRLFFKGEAITLADWSPAGSLIHIEAQPIPLWQLWKGEMIHGW